MNDHFDVSRWQQLPFSQQMGNIGSEVGRSMKAIERSDEKSLQAAYYRGLDLIDATATSPNLTLARRRELLRAREQFSAAVEARRIDQKLDGYFMTFALIARATR